MAQPTPSLAASMPRPPLADKGVGLHDVTQIIAGPAEIPLRKTPPLWLIGFTGAVSLLLLLVGLVGYLLWEGTGVWGLNIPHGWGWAIINFVWWIGIGHAGTLISAVLFLFRQKWRTAINRYAEAMTLFAVLCAGMYPLIHVGRAWLAYWMFPIPNQMDVWPQFRSALQYDVVAISTYGTVSLLFWYVGLIPDLAAMRDRATHPWRQRLYGLFALGWRGAGRHWRNYERAYLILAAIATPLVLSVHSIVSFDFATTLLPGWHTTIFPPYFVVGAVFSGFALVTTLMVISRQFFGFEKIVTMRHMENMAKIMLVTGSIVGYAYAMEFFMAWYSGNRFEIFAFINRTTGPYWWAYCIMVTCNVVVPQFFWFRRVRTSPWALFVLSILINVGMWFERFVIVVTLHADFLPSSWGYYRPTWVDIGTFAGTFGLFFTFFMLFWRFLPQISITEVKHILPAGHDGAQHP